MTTEARDRELKELGKILLEIGTLLLAAGASTSRTRNTISRISSAYSYRAEFAINNRTLLLSLGDLDHELLFNGLKRSEPYGVNFRLLSGISKLSWNVAEESLDLDAVKERLDQIKREPHYPRLLVLVLVGIAGSAFCRVNGGEIQDMLIVFIATVAGLFIRQEAVKLRFNHYVCIYFAAFAASLITGAATTLAHGYFHEAAFATSVLFLIPGVPFINTFSDMIESNLHNALIRGLNCLIISFAIGLGLLSSMFIFNL